MAKKNMKDEDREWLVEMIAQNKDQLVGKFDDSKGITKDSKMEAWVGIFNASKAKELSFTKGTILQFAKRLLNF